MKINETAATKFTTAFLNVKIFRLDKETNEDVEEETISIDISCLLYPRHNVMVSILRITSPLVFIVWMEIRSTLNAWNSLVNGQNRIRCSSFIWLSIQKVKPSANQYCFDQGHPLQDRAPLQAHLCHLWIRWWLEVYYQTDAPTAPLSVPAKACFSCGKTWLGAS